MITKNRNILRFKDGTLLSTEDMLLSEIKREIYVNGEHFFTLKCTDIHLEELALGVLFSGGLISSFEDVDFLEFSGLNIMAGISQKEQCQRQEEKNELKKAQPVPPVDYCRVLEAYGIFADESELFRETGGVHSAKLMDAQMNRIFMTEDMGRHNAIDKVIGYGLREGLNFEDKILMVSSRMPLELIEKCFGAGILTVASVSVATNEAVEFAVKHNMNLMGMCRNNRFNIYAQREE